MLPKETSDDDNDYQEQDNSRVELERGVAASGPRRYAYRDLAAATNNFAEDGKLGRGGFGSVYRGTLTVAGEERPVAIKMLSSDSSAQGRKEFEAEVRIISRLKSIATSCSCWVGVTAAMASCSSTSWWPKAASTGISTAATARTS